MEKTTQEVINLIKTPKNDKLQSFIFVFTNVSNKNFCSSTEKIFFNLEVVLAQLAECLQIRKLL